MSRSPETYVQSSESTAAQLGTLAGQFWLSITGAKGPLPFVVAIVCLVGGSIILFSAIFPQNSNPSKNQTSPITPSKNSNSNLVKSNSIASNTQQTVKSATIEQVKKGELLYKQINRKYNYPLDVGNAFLPIGTPNVHLLIPTPEWNKLNKIQKSQITYYAESLVLVVKSDPVKYANAWKRYAEWSDQLLPGTMQKLSNLCAECWGISTGKVVWEKGRADMIGDEEIESAAAISLRN